MSGKCAASWSGATTLAEVSQCFTPLPLFRQSWADSAQSLGTNVRMWSILWNRIHIYMETIQIVLDKRLLHAADQAARRTKRNRSALIRDALREHLRRLEVQVKEERDREGYSRQPHAPDESLVWEAEAAWPAE